MLVVAGGFCYADALGAGRLLALELDHGLGDELPAFVAAGRPVIGICNGFQALVRTGLLPGPGLPAALGPNDTGRFECRWVHARAPVVAALRVDRAASTEPIDCPIAHGEGRFACDPEHARRPARRRPDRPHLRRRQPQRIDRRHRRRLRRDRRSCSASCPTPRTTSSPASTLRPPAAANDAAGLGLALFEQGVRHAKEL